MFYITTVLDKANVACCTVPSTCNDACYSQIYTSQELGSGIQIFTGSSAVHWFIKNMEGVSSMQNAQVWSVPNHTCITFYYMHTTQRQRIGCATSKYCAK